MQSLPESLRPIARSHPAQIADSRSVPCLSGRLWLQDAFWNGRLLSSRVPLAGRACDLGHRSCSNTVATPRRAGTPLLVEQDARPAAITYLLRPIAWGASSAEGEAPAARKGELSIRHHLSTSASPFYSVNTTTLHARIRPGQQPALCRLQVTLIFVSACVSICSCTFNRDMALR